MDGYIGGLLFVGLCYDSALNSFRLNTGGSVWVGSIGLGGNCVLVIVALLIINNYYHLFVLLINHSYISMQYSVSQQLMLIYSFIFYYRT